MLINNFSKLPPYHPSTLVCSSPPALRESLYEQACEWVRALLCLFQVEICLELCERCHLRFQIIDLYPRGIWFQQCYLIVWQGTVVVPEVVMRTVRMSIRCRDPPPRDDLTVKIGVLVSGVTCNIEHVVEVAHYVHKFSASDTTFNINDLLSYSKLNDRFNLLPRVDEPVSAFKPVSGNTCDMPYLIGSERNTLKLQVIIIPLCPKLSLIDEPYNSTFCSVVY